MHIHSFIKSGLDNGAAFFAITNYKTVKACRHLYPQNENGRRVRYFSHLRAGKISEGEARGRQVRAYYRDELGNIVALCSDGIVRQFYGPAKRS
jgi:hypothetical protein